jgi:hypothetical protein
VSSWTVSGAHAKIEAKDNKVYITDLESTNGTYIDSKKISSNTPVELKPGSVVVFGKHPKHVLIDQQMARHGECRQTSEHVSYLCLFHICSRMLRMMKQLSFIFIGGRQCLFAHSYEQKSDVGQIGI